MGSTALRAKEKRFLAGDPITTLGSIYIGGLPVVVVTGSLTKLDNKSCLFVYCLLKQ